MTAGIAVIDAVIVHPERARGHDRPTGIPVRASVRRRRIQPLWFCGHNVHRLAGNSAPSGKRAIAGGKPGRYCHA